MPMPRNDSAASASTALPIPSVPMTSSGPTMLGRICVRMMFQSLNPAAFAAST